MASQPQNPDAEQTAPASTPKILEPEFNALNHCLKDAVVKTGQIYGFYANSRNLGIDTHVPNPPRSMTAALGRSIERYDQICDSIEAHLTRAINVLERDLRREKERLEAEERRKQTEALMLPPPAPAQTSETVTEIPAAQSSTEDSGTNPRNSPVSTVPGRRPSAISISSLHRPFPLKLDLSSTSLRISEEEAAMFQKGLASPVTLAPKSARAIGPNEFPPELMAAFNEAPGSLDVPHPDMDLNLANNIQPKSDLTTLGVGLGDSSDKPIELDLDSMDIEMTNMNHFGNPVEMNEPTDDHEGDGLFSPLQDTAEGEGADGLQAPPKEGDSNTYNMDSKANQELFGDFSSTSGVGVAMETDSSMPEAHPNEMVSPGDLLAQFSSAQETLPSSNPLLQGGGEPFDLNSIDLSNLASEFYAQGQDGDMNFSMDMDTFLNMDTAPEHRPDGDSDQTQNYT